MFKNLLRNFRFWILIGGIIFYIAGLVMKGFGTPGILPCPGDFRIPPCADDTLYGVGSMFLSVGSLLVWVGIILCLVQITARFIEKRFLKKKTD